MRKMVIIFLAICFMITGCRNDEITITSAQIKDLFEKHGLLLEPTGLNPSPIAVFSRTYNEIAPERFVIDENQSISIYIYSSSKEAKRGLKDFEDKIATADVVPHSRYQIANVLIFYITDDAFKDERVELVVVEDIRSLTK